MAHIAGYLHAAAAAAAAPDGGPTLASPPLFLCDGRATSAVDASKRVASLAAGLTRRLGVQPGDRVCLAAQASDVNLEALLAVTSAGAVAAPLNWRWGATEGAAAARLVGARLLLADAACLPWALRLASASRGAVAALVLLGPLASFDQADLAAVPAGTSIAFAESLITTCPDTGLALATAPGGVALIVYTSGTTGKPKGVALTHAALHAQCMAKLLTCGYSASDVYLHAAPLFHIGGLSSALAMLAVGARHVFLPRFEGAAALRAIQEHSVTSFIAVPTMVADLAGAASEAGVAALPSVSRVLVGGGGMSAAIQARLAELCPAAAVHTAYGMTEGCSSLSFATLWGPGRGPAVTAAAAAEAPAGQGQQAAGVCVGRPPPGIELAVYHAPAGGDAGLGRVQLAGEGEVLTRGPHVMLGYWDDEAGTAAAQLPGGWLRTGDLGCLRQGQLWLLGRAKDMIKTGGENVHAWEVERALASHPAVAAAAVVGAADWRLGEAVAAAVVLRPSWRWRGARCQVLLLKKEQLLQQQSGSAAARSALAAARTVVGQEEGGGGQQASVVVAVGGGGSSLYQEDLRSTLLQLSSSHPSSALSGLLGSSEGGLLTAPTLPLQLPHQQRQRQPDALQQLQAVAAGLHRAAAASGGSQALGGDASGHGGADEADMVVDGSMLQQHCRAAGLAGFKLPRVFMHCDAASAAAPSRGSGSVVLPLNSTGKVVKHLLREQVQQHMAAASKAAAAAPGGGAGGGGSGSGAQQRSRL